MDMINETILRQPIETLANTVPDGLNYFFLFLLFGGVILAVVIVIYFCKWLTMGPKLKKRWAKITRRDRGDSVVEGVQIKGKEVIVDADHETSLQKKIAESESPQEKLAYQAKLDSHKKEKKRAEEQIKADEDARLAKIEEKEERNRIKQEAKDLRKKEKEKGKEEK